MDECVEWCLGFWFGWSVAAMLVGPLSVAAWADELADSWRVAA